MRALPFWIFLFVTLAASQGPAAIAGTASTACRSADDVRAIFYGDVWDGDVVECVGQLTVEQLPEKIPMQVVALVARGDYAAATALVPRNGYATSGLPKSLHDAVVMYITVKERLGLSAFSATMRVQDFTNNAVFRDPLKFESPLLLLPLYNEVSNLDLFQQLVDKVQVGNAQKSWPFIAKGRLAVMAEKPSIAISILSFALSVHGPSPTLRYWLARAFELDGRFEKAYSEYTAFIQQFDTPCTGLISRSVLLGILKRRTEAITDASAAIETCASKEAVLQAHHNRAGYYRELGDLKAAEKDYTYVIENASFFRRFIAQLDFAGVLFKGDRVGAACRMYLNLADATRQKFKVSLGSSFLTLLANIATCLSESPQLSANDVESYLDHFIFALSNLSAEAREEAVISALFGLMDIHERQNAFLYPDIGLYYERIKQARQLESKGTYRNSLDLLAVFGGERLPIMAAFQSLKEGSVELEAFAVFLVERFLKTRKTFTDDQLGSVDLSAVKVRVMKNDDAQSTYFSLQTRYSKRK